MTREEAIERIRQNKAAAEFYARYTNNDKDIENELKDVDAFCMAIEALQAESTHGRPIDADALKKYFFRPYSNEESYSNIDIAKIIDNAPTISVEAAQGIGRYENAMQKLREMPRYLNDIKAKQIRKIPSKVVQGEWVDEDGNKVLLDKDGYPLGSCWCNQCHEWLVGSDEYAIKGNFCPNCGVKMKGGIK